MIFMSLPDFSATLPAKGRLMGLDIGEKWVGVALSDPDRSLATPETRVARRPTTVCLQSLITLASGVDTVGIVIGLPLSMEGGITPMAQSAKAFAHLLQKQGSVLPILLWDERFSTAIMQRSLIEADLSRKKRANVIDKLAASYILQGVLAG